jgi:hypothetical protein
MNDIYTYLNYGSFAGLYILGLMFTFKKYTEILGFFMLTIVHTAFMIFSGKSFLLTLQEYFTKNEDIYSDRVNGGMALIVGLLFSGMTLHMVSLILIILMLITLRNKFNETNGAPITLSKRYQRYLDTYKSRLIPIFIIIFTLTVSILFFPEAINKPLLRGSIVESIMSSDRIGFNLMLLVSIVLVTLSSQEVYYSNLFISQRRQLLIK